MHIHTHIYTYTYTYIHIHTHTYPLKFSVGRGFCAAAAAAHNSYAQRRLPRSARTGLRTGSSSAHCDWRAHGLCRGAALVPPTRAARKGAPKRVWEWVPDRGIKWQGCCPWLSWVGPAGCRPLQGMFQACCGHQHIKEYMWSICGLHMYTCIHMYTHVYTCMPIHTIHAHMDWFQNLQMQHHVYTCMHIHAIHAHMDWFQNLQM